MIKLFLVYKKGYEECLFIEFIYMLGKLKLDRVLILL